MKEKSVLILPLLALIVLCSCGVRSTDISKTPEKEVEVATGSAITTVFKNSDTTEKTDPLENDFISVFANDAGDWKYKNLDGTGTQKLPIEYPKDGYFEVWWVTNDWMYVGMFDKKSSIGRIPINREAQPMVDIENMEVLIENADIDMLDELIVTDSYIFYLAYNEKRDATVGYRYDFSTKENRLILEVKEEYCELWYKSKLPLVVGNNFILSGDDDLYVLSVDQLESKTICSGDSMEDSLLVEYEGVLYFTQGLDDSIYKYDGDNATCLIEAKALYKAISEMDLADKNAYDIDCWIDEISVQNGKLYAIIEVDWMSKEKWAEGPHKGETVQNDHDRMYLISTDIDDFSEWKLDDTLTEFMSNNFKPDAASYDTCDNDEHHGYYRTNAKDTVDTEVDEIEFGCDGKIYAYVDQHNRKELYYAYNIATGKTQQIDEDEYYEKIYPSEIY